MIRVRQLGIVLAGLVLAGAMVVLGIWQYRVYVEQGAAAAAARAEAPAVPLSAVAVAGSSVRDGYGRSVVVSGTYLSDRQLLVPPRDPGDPGRRVLTPLRLPDGSVVAVVRGMTAGFPAPAAPAGVVRQTGILLPSEEAGAAGSEPLDSVRVPVLAQRWPEPLVDGFVTVTAQDAAAAGLDPAPVALPEGRGRLRNGAYALQWWVFAAFAVLLSGRMARDLGRADLVGQTVTAPGNGDANGQAPGPRLVDGPA